MPLFSVLPNVVASGLRAVGVEYSDAHLDSNKMAQVAGSTYELFGFESAIVPFDLCVEAEAMGARVDFHPQVDAFIQPIISRPIELPGVNTDLSISEGGRVDCVARTITQLKEGVGRDIVVGAVVPGPFTLGWELFGIEAWLPLADASLRDRILDNLARELAVVARIYVDAGADFVTVHEMGGSPQVLGAKRFVQFVKPTLQKLFAQINSLKILSICGDTNTIVPDLAECGADALNLDHRNNLKRTRAFLPKSILLGNLDPVGELAHGTPESIELDVKRVAADGADAVVPGCDLYIETPDANMRALVESASKLGR